MAAQTKTCSNPECEQENPQPLSAFHKKKCRPNGLDSRCKTCRRAYMKKRYTANRSRLLQQQKAYNQTEDAKKKRRISAKARGTTPWQKLKEKFAKHLLNFVINGYDSPLNQATMGCTYAEIRAHIESQFKDGMAWDNYGDVWEFDHIVPYKAFPTVEELDKHHKIVCWYKNVRPLPPPDNRSDGANYKEEDKQALIRRVPTLGD